jgi:hypothetical protein
MGHLMDLSYLTNLVVVGEHESGVVWQGSVVLYKHLFLLFARRFVLGPSWIEQPARNRLNAVLAICDCLRR